MRAVIGLLAVLLSAQICYGVGVGDVEIHLNGEDDIVYANGVNTLEIWIMNDEDLESMDIGFNISWHPAMSLTWNLTYGNKPPIMEHDGAIGAWSLGGLMSAYDFDNATPDSIHFGGACMYGGQLPAGGHRLCYSLQFETSTPEGLVFPDGFKVECYAFGPAGGWLFHDADGYPPDFNGHPVSSIPEPVAPPALFDITGLVVSTSPAENELNVLTGENIWITFAAKMDETTIDNTSIVVNGSFTGLHNGWCYYYPGIRKAAFVPAEEFDEGELITVVLTTGIQSESGVPLSEALSWSFTTLADGGDAVLDPAVNYAAVGQPYSIVTPDVNGDGFNDLVTANLQSFDVSVFFNDGDGTFTRDADYPVSDFPNEVCAGDFNEDGLVDVAAVCAGPNHVVVLLNDGPGGAGTFSIHGTFATGFDNSRSVKAADFDGDGHLDLACAGGTYNTGNVAILLGAGNGDFVQHSSAQVVDAPRSIFAGDLDGDFDMDLVTTSWQPDNNLTVLLNDGDALFPTRRDFSLGRYPRHALAADLDGDGDLDLVGSNGNSHDISILMNYGDATFAPAIDYSCGSGNPTMACAADLDADGDLDLAVGESATDAVSVFLNDGDGLFSQPLISPVGVNPHSLSAVDLDGDGNLDIAAANANGGTISILLNQDVPLDLGFIPNIDGWSFANTSANLWPYSVDFPSWDLFVEAFGPEQCFHGTPPNSSRPKQSAVEYWRAIQRPHGGSCGGFASASLLFFDGFMDVGTVFGYPTLYDVPLMNASRDTVNVYQLYQFGEFQKRAQNESSRSEPVQTLQAFKNVIRDQTQDDYFIVAAGPGSAHAMVPYSCNRDQTFPHVWSIWVYDPNFPGDASKRILVDTDFNSMWYGGLHNWNRIYLMGPISSFTQLPLLPIKTIEIIIKDEWPSGGRGDESQYTEFYFPDVASVLFESTDGIIGYDGDSLFSTLTDGMPITPISEDESVPIGYFLPAGVWTCELSGITDSAFRFSVFDDSTAMIYTRSGASPYGEQSFGYDDHEEAFTILNSDPGRYNYAVEMIFAVPDSEIVCGVSGVDMSPGDSARFSFTDETSWQIDNYGDGTTYNVTVEISDEDSGRLFSSTGVTLADNSSHRILPDWGPNGDTLVILVDIGMTGLFLDTIRIENEWEPPDNCGDADGSGSIDIDDAVLLVYYIFVSGPAPDPLEAGDANCSGGIDIDDVVYLINYIFSGGYAPCDMNGDGEPDC